MRKLVWAIMAAMAGLWLPAVTTGAYASLLVNGSFETGDFTGWTQSGNTGDTSVCSLNCNGSYGPEQGSYFVDYGPVGSDGFLSQTFADTVGQHYRVSGWLAGNGTSASDWGLYWNSTPVVYVNPVPNQPYTYYSALVTGTGSDTFAVGFRNDPSYDAFDNLSVDPVATPLPAALPLFAGGLGMIGLVARRRKRKAAADAPAAA